MDNILKKLGGTIKLFKNVRYWETRTEINELQDGIKDNN